MLAYLDALLRGLTERDTAEINRLLAHPLARILTHDALGEVQAAATGETRGAPLRVLQLRHQTAQLLGNPPAVAAATTPSVAPAAADVAEPRRSMAPPRARRSPARYQIELPLSA